MKKTAFFQALVILLLLLISWGFFYFKRLPPAEQPDPEVTAENQTARQLETETDPEPVVKEAGRALGKIINPEAISPLWDECIQYLSEQQNPAEMRLALAAMKEALFSMEDNDSMARLLELMFSRVNVDLSLIHI